MLGQSDGSTGNRGLWLREVWRSTIGKKVFVAGSGLVLAGYVVAHALGNLKAVQGNGDGGEAPIDTYAEWIRTAGKPVLPEDTLLWGARAILLLALVIHVVGIAQLTARSQAARPAGHTAERRASSIASRTMLASGLLLLAFIVFHILQFTTGTIQATPIVTGEVYANVHHGFQELWMVVIYVAIVALLGLHLRHALWSVTQTAGWDKPNRNTTIRRFASTTALVVTIGFAAVPIAIYAGALPEPEESPAELVAK